MQLLSAVTPGTLVKLNENGSPVEFYVAKHDYESGLNGPGRTLLVRAGVNNAGVWFTYPANAYADSNIDTWFNETYKAFLDSWVQTSINVTTFYYTPRLGTSTVTTLARAVFALSVTEVGLSAPHANSEGTVLPIAYTLRMLGSSYWTRTIYNNGEALAYLVNSSGNVQGDNGGTSYRPCFTLPGALFVWDDGSINQTVPAPASITTPALIMQGNSVSISWDGISGVDSYILQRKADSGEWEQVYAGNDLTFTDTAGAWSNVQYQVCGVFGGTNGAFAQSEVITVQPASALVISGADGDLGTVTSDIPYSVATDTGNQISLTRTVNGVLVASLTVDGGFAYNIPVMDLPTGTGTIVITATVQTSSGPVTVTRTWTYTKAAQTFPGSGGLAQLAQDGQNMFPLTLAEAVKTIGGPWGGNLSTALDKLALAATYTATAVPKYTQVTVDLSTAQAGDIVNLPENGVMVPFYVASLDYESDLNGPGKTLLVRVNGYQNGVWGNYPSTEYNGSTIDTWFNSNYKELLDSSVKEAISETQFYYTVSQSDKSVAVLAREIFTPSLTEYGFSNLYANVEGTALQASEKLQTAKAWTRTPYIGNIAGQVFIIGGGGTVSNTNQSHPYRPCFTLPATFSATYYVDPNSGTVHPSQEYTTAGDFADLWGNIIPTVKIETGSYTGTGTYGSSNPNKLTFAFPPKLVLVFSGSSESFMIIPAFAENPDGDGSSFVRGGSNTCQVYEVAKTVDGNSLNWWVSGITQPYIQFNTSGRTYNYIAIG